MLFWISLILFASGSLVCLWNAYLSFVRPQYYKWRKPNEQCPWIPKVFALGSLCVAISLIEGHKHPAWLWGGFILIAFDTGGIHWFIFQIVRFRLFQPKVETWDERAERYCRECVDRWGQIADEFAPGLSEDEIAAVELWVGAPMPPELRACLSAAVPVGDRWPDWRDEPDIRKLVENVWNGIAFDIRENDVWKDWWRKRPESVEDRLAEAKRIYDKTAPKMYPIYGHRYLPSQSGRYNKPVFSIVQTDIVVYGDNLFQYLSHEFGDGEEKGEFAMGSHVHYWDLMAEG